LLAHPTFTHTVEEKARVEYMTVLPNPTRGNLRISTKKRTDYHIIESIELMNMEGRVVQHWGVSPVKFSLDIGHHPPGVYVLNVTTNVGSQSFKVILER
ncbi:MAG: T9SS type A sorting domain-containing protein, partial [Bacteroidota bacterium]